MKFRYLILLFIIALFFVDNLTKFSYFEEDINKRLYNNSVKTYISEDLENYQEFNFWDYLYKKVNSFSIKIVPNENLNEIKYLTIVSDMDSLKYTNAKYTKNFDTIIVKLEPNNPKELIFTYEYKNLKRGEFRFNEINEFEYNYIYKYEGILYGLAYGIIFSAFLYYFVIFFSTRKKYFLYYSLMQFFVLLSLVGFTYFSFKPHFNSLEQALVDICETLGFLFSLLFAREILQTKERLKEFDFILKIFIVLNVLDLFAITIFKYSILYYFLPFYITFFILTITGIYSQKQEKNKYVKIYTIGWFLMTLLIFAAERGIFPISSIYVIHIAAPLESLIFSFALAYMLKNMVDKQNEQEKILIHKSKLASLGEMIDNIAHQWRQPLAHLGYINMNLQVSTSKEEFDKTYFSKKFKESSFQIKFMSETIDNFRNFYKIEKREDDFLISDACNLAVNIISPTLKKRGIILNLEIKKDSKINGFENEYAQVILNFLTNCIDIFKERNTKNPTINICIDLINKRTCTKVCDNAGGIDEHNIEKIFEANFSTKKRASGIGLYMSKLIIQSHFNGEIKASNTKDGACFEVNV